MRFNKNRPGLKRLVAYALIMAMLLTLMPTSAFAARQSSPFSWLFQRATAQTKQTPAEEPVAEEPAAEEPAEEPAAEEPAEEPAPEEAPAEEPAAEEPAAEEPEEAPAEPETPAIVQELKVGKLTVSIDAEPGAFPEGTKVKAKKANVKDVQKTIDKSKDVDGEVLFAVDITFTLKGKELQPAEGKSVKVEFNAPELKDKAKKAAVVHIDGETQKPELIEDVEAIKDDAGEENGVSFEADSFSIYAVVEPGDTAPQARIEVNFYGYDKTKPVATFWVKNADDLDQITMNVVDPGIGAVPEQYQDTILFRGWSLDVPKHHDGTAFDIDEEDLDEYVGANYDAKFKYTKTIEDVRDYLYKLASTNSIKEGDVLDIYAVLYEGFHVTYYGSDYEEGEENISLGKQIAYRLVGETSAEYEINMGYATDDASYNFKGWLPVENANAITPPLASADDFYTNGTTITITNDVAFRALAPHGYWLVFYANGKGATYNAPQFCEGDDVTPAVAQQPESAKPENMKRRGYTFAGWYYAKEEEVTETDPETGVETTTKTMVPDEERGEITFPITLTDDTNIIAKWTENTTAPYTVVCWVERLTPGENGELYDIADTQVFSSGTVGQPIPNNIVDNGDEDYVTTAGDGKGHYTGFCLDHEGNTLYKQAYKILRDEDENPILDEDGNEQFVLDADGNKIIETVAFAVPTVTSDGEAVLNLYFKRISYSFKFYLYRERGTVGYLDEYELYTGSTPSTNDWQSAGPYFGLINGTYTRVYYRSVGNNFNNFTGWTTSTSNNANTARNAQYQGNIYTQVPDENSFTPNGNYDYANNSSGGRNPYTTNDTSDNNGLVTWTNNQSNHPSLGADYAEEHGLQTEVRTHDGQTFRYYYFTIEAKYGENISEQWPLYDTDVVGVGSRDPVSYVMMVGTKLKPDPDATGDGTVKGIISVLNENILGATNDADGNYVIIRFPTSYNNWRYHIWYEVVDGKDIDGNPIGDRTTQDYDGKTYYEADVLIVRSSNTNVSSQNQPKYDAFDFVTKKGQNWNATNVTYWTTTQGNTTLYHLNYLYDRQKAKINYYDGQYYDGNGNRLENRAELPLKASEEIILGTDISAYGDPDDEEHYYNPENDPENENLVEGYRFAGWYLNETCTEPYTFTTMPQGGIKVFAKWVQIQYRVYLHANALILQGGKYVDDETLSWGDEQSTEKQSMCFRISYGDVASVPSGFRQNYSFRGWYWDPALTKVYSSKTELNETTVTDAYDMAEDKTDIIDMYGNVVEKDDTYRFGGETLTADKAPYNSDDADHNDRWWIEKKLELYAKWQQRLVGAQGITLVYDAGENEGEFENVTTGDRWIYTDPDPYEDNSEAVAAAAPESTVEGQQFLYYVIQMWDGEKYVDAKDENGELIISYPGDDITVLAAYAKITEEGTGTIADPNALDDNKTYVYTMQVRAEYGPTEIPKDTYFNWYRNYKGDSGLTGEAAVNAARLHHNEELQINESVMIYTLDPEVGKGIPTPEREGYTFLGWARENEFAEEPVIGPDGRPTNDPVLYHKDPELYMKWDADAGKYYIKDPNDEDAEDFTVPVTEVAADELMPYQAWYAVWEHENPYFTVIYSSQMDVEYTIKLEDPAQKVDLYNGNQEGFVDLQGNPVTLPGVHSGYLYGGYYTEAPAEDGKWNMSKAGTVKGTEMTPEDEGVYYVKEVSDKYLAPYYKYTYIGSEKRVTGLWDITVLDDLNYNEAGFVVWNAGYYELGEEDEDEYSTTSVEPDGPLPFDCDSAYTKLTVYSYNANKLDPETGKPTIAKQEEVLPTNLYPDAGKYSRLIYIGIEEIFGDDFVDCIREDRLKASFSAIPYWKTPDNIIVFATKFRTITIHPTEKTTAKASQKAAAQAGCNLMDAFS